MFVDAAAGGGGDVSVRRKCCVLALKIPHQMRQMPHLLTCKKYVTQACLISNRLAQKLVTEVILGMILVGEGIHFSF